METYLVIKPAFPQRNQRVLSWDRNVLKYSASSGKFPDLHNALSFMTRYTIKLLARIVFPLGETSSEGERGGGVGTGRVCGLLDSVDTASFWKIITVFANIYQI